MRWDDRRWQTVRAKCYWTGGNEQNGKMTTMMIGTLSTFDAKEQTWEEYCEVLDQFFEANGIDDGEKQRAILISVVGPAT